MSDKLPPGFQVVNPFPDFSRAFDLVAHLRARGNEVKGETKTITVKACPSYILTQFERVGHKLREGSYIFTSGEIYSALIDWGVTQICQFPETRELTALRQAINGEDGNLLKMRAQSELTKKLKQGSTDFHLGDQDGYMQLSFRATEFVRGRIAMAANITGLELRTVTPLALAIGLATQENVHPEFPGVVERETELLQERLGEKAEELRKLFKFFKENP